MSRDYLESVRAARAVGVEVAREEWRKGSGGLRACVMRLSDFERVAAEAAAEAVARYRLGEDDRDYDRTAILADEAGGAA